MWSFGAEVVLDDLSQHNVIIGKNNVGKSNILSAIKWLKDQEKNFGSNTPFAITDDVRHDPGNDNTQHSPLLSIRVNVSDDERTEILEPIMQVPSDNRGPDVLIDTFIGKQFEFGIKTTTEHQSEVLPLFEIVGKEPLDVSTVTSDKSQQARISQMDLFNW